MDFAKGKLGKTVTRIDGKLQCEPWGVKATFKEAIVADICDDLKRFRTLNIITKKELHSLVGHLSHAAGLLMIISPVLQPLWAALS